MARLRYNGLTARLGASLTSGATTITFAAALTHSGGTAVPTIAAGNWLPLSILDANGRMVEIVYLTAYTAGATTGTITRAKEGTTAVAHLNGAQVLHGGTVTDLRQPVYVHLNTPAGLASGAISSGMVDVPGLTLTIPEGDWFVSGHIMATPYYARTKLVNVGTGAEFYMVTGFVNQGEGPYITTFHRTPLTVPLGSTTTIKAQWSARDSTAGVTMYQRFLIAEPN